MLTSPLTKLYSNKLVLATSYTTITVLGIKTILVVHLGTNLKTRKV
jgi:hypothetical protein